MTLQLKLVHIEGTKSGRTDAVDFGPLPDHKLTLGRDPSCILAFDPYKDPRVSAHHADIVFADETFWLEDRGSTNGTRINGLKIFERTKLHDGDEIELGRKGARFRIKFDDPEASAGDPGPDVGKNGSSKDYRDRDKPGKPEERRSGDAGALAEEMASADDGADDRKKDKAADKAGDKGDKGDKAGKAAAIAEDANVRIPRRNSRRNDPVVAAALAAAGPPGSGAGVGGDQIGKGSGGGSKIDVGDGHQVGQKTMRLILQNAHELAKKDGGGSLTFFKEVVRQSASESTTTVKLWLFGIVFFVLLMMVTMIVIIVLLMNQLNKLQDKAARDSKDLDDKINKVAENSATAQADLRDRLAQIDRYAVLASPDEFQNRLADLSRQVRAELGAIQDSFHKFEAQNQDTARHFQQIERQYKQSIWLIVSEVTLRDPEGKELRCQSSGSGFIVTPEGHLVTNKHVVQPWKFGTIAARMEAENLSIKPGSEEILAWPAGAEVLRNGALRGDTAKSLSRGTLAPPDTPADRWDFRQFEEYGLRRVHKSNDNSDIAILRLSSEPGRPFVPVPLYQAELAGPGGWRPQKLDPVMAIGFPQGISLFDKTVAETSPSLGTIRKAEDTIHITAPIVKGNSGGPIFTFNERGDPVVIAIATRVVSETETIGICIAIEHALALLKR
ncbi:MAG: FHA domain-containing protein [Planctomycetota bacterium]